MIDIKAILSQMVTVMKDILGTNVPEVNEAIKSYAEGADTRLSDLAKYRLSGDISDKFMADRLADEKDIFLSEMESFKVIGKQLAQDAINSAQDIFLAAVQNAIPK